MQGKPQQGSVKHSDLPNAAFHGAIPNLNAYSILTGSMLETSHHSVGTIAVTFEGNGSV